MNISQLIQTLVTTIVGGVVGGLIVITTNWITAKGKRRQDIQEWYERTYIIEGIDPLVAYYQNLSFSLMEKANGYTIHVVQRDIPVEALGKVRILLLNDVVPLNLITYAHRHLAFNSDRKLLKETANTLQSAVEAFLDFRLKLTEVISSKVNDKHFIVDTTNLSNDLQEVFYELVDLRKQWEDKAKQSEQDSEVEETQQEIKRRNFPHLKRRKVP